MSTPTDLQRTVQRLADLEAIRDLAHRYAHCVWQRDAAQAIALFTDDGVMDTGDRPPIRGHQALLEAYEHMLGTAELHPFVHSHVIEIDGDGARGTCYLDLRAAIEGRSMIGAGFYEDEYARVAGTWKFRSRKLTMRYLVPIEDGWAGASSGRLPGA
jgi:ketosteroid isomerase-like protein